MSRDQRWDDEKWVRSALRLSRRHRTWGCNVPMIDVDSVGLHMPRQMMVEYDRRKPVAIIDYKSGEYPDLVDDARPLWHLAVDHRIPPLPCYIVQFRDLGDELGCWQFKVHQIGPDVFAFMEPPSEWITEEVYVDWLHKIRGR